MKLKKISAIMLSIFMLGSLSACEEEDDSSSKKEIQTETVAVEDSLSSETEESSMDIDSESSDDNANGDSSDSQSLNDTVDGSDNMSLQETIISNIKKSFKTSFNDNIEMTYDEKEKNYNISVWQDGFANSLETEQGAAALDTFSSFFETALDSMVTQIRLLDSEANLTFNFVSDTDKSKILFTIYNGKMTYCITQEK